MSKLHKRGKILCGDERELVYKVIKCYDKEKEAKDYEPYVSSEERASMATGLPVSAVSKIKNEGTITTQSSSKDSTHKDEKSRKVILNHKKLCAFREIIENIYKDMEIPTVRKIIVAARKDMNFQGSRAKVRGILRNKLGFKFNKRYPNNNVVLEHNSVKLSRVIYLQKIRENDALGQKKKPLVFIGEYVTVINNPKKEDKTQVNRIQKHLIFYAGSENGFISDELFSFTLNKEKPKTRPQDFQQYVEHIIPKLPKNCIVAINDSLLHNDEIDAIPTMFTTKEDVKKWMVNHYIPFEEDMTKAELIMQIKKSNPVKEYVVDKLLETNGHKVLRIPKYHTDLNPLEYISMKIKMRVADKRKDDDAISFISKAFRSITAEDWKAVIDHVKTIEERYWLRDAVKEEEYDDVLDSIGMLLSDSDSDSESDMEYWSSSSSEETDEGSEYDWTDVDDDTSN